MKELSIMTFTLNSINNSSNKLYFILLRLKAELFRIFFFIIEETNEKRSITQSEFALFYNTLILILKIRIICVWV